MTLAELQPYVEAAVVALEWKLARAKWKQGLIDERKSILFAIPRAGQYGIEEEPLRARLAQIDVEEQGDVTADRVPQHPIRSVPMDMITTAVVRRILRIPVQVPVIGVRVMPDPAMIADAIEAIAAKWSSPFAAIASDPTL